MDLNDKVGDRPPPGDTEQEMESLGPHRITRREARYGKRGTGRTPQSKTIKQTTSEPKPVSPSVQHNLLYGEALYTVLHRMGCAEPEYIFDTGQLYDYLQKAFSMEPEEHEAILQHIEGLPPPIFCVKVTVKEAKGILGKDVSGFSDPYCMLGIENRANHRSRDNSPSHEKKQRQKAVVRNLIPEDQTHKTQVKVQTLSPVWNETFILEIENLEKAWFHMDMWDSDDVESVRAKLGEITDLHGLRRIFKDARKDKGQDDFLGNVVLRLGNLRCKEDCWYNLEPRTETYPERGQCHLQFLLTHKKRGTMLSKTPSYIVHRQLLQQFIRHEIKCHQAAGTMWDGEISPHGCTILYLHATQKDLSEFHQGLAQWLAYSKLYQSLEFSSSCLLHHITSIEYLWVQGRLQEEQKTELAESFESLLQYGVSVLRKYRIMFPLSASRSVEHLQGLLRVLIQMCKTKAFREMCSLAPSLQERVSDAIKAGTHEWFDMKRQHLQPMIQSQEDNLKSLLSLVTDIISDLQSCHKTWNKCFLNTVKLDIFSLTFLELEELVSQHLLSQLPSPNHSSQPPLSELLYQLYITLRELHKLHIYLPKRDVPLPLSGFHRWFVNSLPNWLLKAYTTAQERVQRAVQIDQLVPLSELQKHSASTVDLSTCFTQIGRTWQQLDWPDPEEAFMIMVKFTEDMCRIALSYCTMIKKRAEEISERGDAGQAANKLCLVVNNIEQLHLVVQSLPVNLDWEGLQRKTREVISTDQFKHTLYGQLEIAVRSLDHEIRSVVQALAQKLVAGIAKHLHSLAAASDSKDLSDCVIPLMRFLESELQYMNQNLVHENFNCLLSLLWSHILTVISSLSRHISSSPRYYKRLHVALKNLELCFHAEGCGLQTEDLHTPIFTNLEKELELCSSSTQKVIECYYQQRIQEQLETTSEKYGAVTVKASYLPSDQKLRVEILNAVNLLPRNSNGGSDPFVQLSLEPKHVFPAVEQRSTQIQKNEQNPLYDETFDFLVTSGQCEEPGACLLLAVFDYDTFLSNSLEGEAFLALADLPGLQRTELEGSDVMVNIPQRRLPLTHPKPGDRILDLLESRRSDKEAAMFVKLRKQRVRQCMKCEK
ncbi:protein unc-13 homolog D isoform X2 [Spea bombifrons]|uniref:protein unc-13 homolog D isoform X2 n=1 Tax=Spea bombifrons TaxID=233779 RepID=UPI00234B6905|nr:protein unc-13 homolog D isoform X2 [Spea bombifrons]